MDAHELEGMAAVAGMADVYGGTSPGYWDGNRRRWRECDVVIFGHDGATHRGCIIAANYHSQRDSYTIRFHVAGGGSEVVEVLDRDIFIY